MKKFLNLAVILISLLFVSCNKIETESPFIHISDIVATKSSVSFRVKTENSIYFEYSVAKKGAVHEYRKENADKKTITISDLEPDTEYTISLYAYSEDGTKSAEIIHEFITNPNPTICISVTHVTHNSASIQFSLSNSSQYKYRYFEKNEDAEWITDETDLEKIELNDLKPSTLYTIQAIAENQDGEGPISSAEFQTLEEPNAIEIVLATTSSVIITNYILNPDMCSGAYISNPVDVNDQYANIKDISEFLDDVEKNPYYYNEVSKCGFLFTSYLKKNTEYVVFSVIKDSNGKIIKESAQETKISTIDSDNIGASQATVKIKNCTMGATYAEISLEMSDDAILYNYNFVEKSILAEFPSIEDFVKTQFNYIFLNRTEAQEQTITLPVLKPNTEYCIYALALDSKAMYSNISYIDVKTKEVSFDPTSNIEVSLSYSDFTTLIFNVKQNNCSKVRYTYYKTDDINNDDEYYFNNLYNPYAQEMPIDDSRFKMEWLDYDCEYTFFALPVKKDGGFGTKIKFTGKTMKYINNGNATINISISGIDYSNPQFPIAKIKLSPDNRCSSYIYTSLTESVFEQNKFSIADYICRSGSFTTVDPAEEKEISVTLWGDNVYVIAIPLDNNGNWSSAIVSDIIKMHE